MADDLLFSVSRGTPTAEELAAVTAALLTALPRSSPPPDEPGVSAWVRSGRSGARGTWRTPRS
ncbi:acyl-CoA carboxylase epsilon subunit [Spirilliplanes yamanashiensis]|uniref:Acyl-CoA carboxylase subunit epsilon n=1 Tax=Spirilliplanes yamanashiensis TaxID=42233 RepID=A0A8J3Y3R6_9ACTN|nr:acyl-CoA carboxylase epsilon subunit [Spirilliplanes yamanashiensis]GIJ00880.1 hypothetical protein Sya03_02320 [Spirilliplanes yamanashiensis]